MEGVSRDLFMDLQFIAGHMHASDTTHDSQGVFCKKVKFPGQKPDITLRQKFRNGCDG
jgi:hypothetical protein